MQRIMRTILVGFLVVLMSFNPAAAWHHWGGGGYSGGYSGGCGGGYCGGAQLLRLLPIVLFRPERLRLVRLRTRGVFLRAVLRWLRGRLRLMRRRWLRWRLWLMRLVRRRFVR